MYLKCIMSKVVLLGNFSTTSCVKGGLDRAVEGKLTSGDTTVGVVLVFSI